MLLGGIPDYLRGTYSARYRSGGATEVILQCSRVLDIIFEAGKRSCIAINCPPLCTRIVASRAIWMRRGLCAVCVASRHFAVKKILYALRRHRRIVGKYSAANDISRVEATSA